MLATDEGQMSDGISETNDYNAEARTLLRIITDTPDWPGARRFTAKDMAFVRSLQQEPGRIVTQRMVFWLRDIRDRAIEGEGGGR